MTTVTELGCAGHLIVSSRCSWHRHTQIGTRYRVSTIGNYTPRGSQVRETIGSGEHSFFETMVFETEAVQVSGNEGCGCYCVRSYSEIDQDRYATAGEAQAGHERFVTKYTELAS